MTDNPQEKKAGWGVIGMLAAAQFIMVLDTTVMNVSITQVAEDLNTTVVGLQTAITMYTLVMAAFMLLGGKLGDRGAPSAPLSSACWSTALGSLITALSPTLGVLLVGWSFIEGFGAVLVIPAIAALTAATYTGRQRALAYGILGGVSGASAALGPLIGGWVTTYYTWRLVFAGETVVVLVLMLFLRLIPKTADARANSTSPARSCRPPAWAWPSSASSGPASGAGSRPSAGCARVTLLGLSPVFWLIIGGLVLLGLFARHERRMHRGGQGAAARHPAAGHSAHAGRPDHLAMPAVHHHGHLLRAPALSANGPGLRCPGDRHHSAAPIVGLVRVCPRRRAAWPDATRPSGSSSAA